MISVPAREGIGHFWDFGHDQIQKWPTLGQPPDFGGYLYQGNDFGHFGQKWPTLEANPGIFQKAQVIFLKMTLKLRAS